MPVSRPVLCEKAAQLLHDGESVPPFQARRGWLRHFCQRHRIWQLSLQGEKVSSDTTKVEPFKMQLQKLLELEALTLEQLYNCDETGLASECFQAKCLPLDQRKKLQA